MITILDCYTDEPAGLGVPPYLGTYPRYIAGYLEEQGESYKYITIDDLRLLKKYNLKQKIPKASEKTNITTYNLTKNINNIQEILDNTSELIIILGVHTPGKYLSAVPGTIKEVTQLTSDLECKKTLTGPAIFGTQSEGGKFFEKNSADFNIEPFDFTYEEIAKYAVTGAAIIKQIPGLRIIEIETSKGCSRAKHCSFCTEPIKHGIEFRKREDVLREISAFSRLKCNHFRLGKQSCFYSYPEASQLLKQIRSQNKNIQTLHIDNVNPANVTEALTKDIVKYCTEGNIAAFGVESFDPEVIKANDLNSDQETTLKAIRIINRYGKQPGPNGMPKFLPGLNLLFGLIGESKQTHNHNMQALQEILDSGLLLRRINIRQVSIFEGTPIYAKVGNKFIKKNKKHYWKWKDEIRHKIDLPMLKNLAPEGTVLKSLRTEIYDGKTTFARQIGTYPLIVGIKQRLPLNKFFDVRITGHMLRSLVGEKI